MKIANKELIINNKQILNPQNEDLYINGVKNNSSEIDVKNGDCIYIHHLLLYNHDDYFRVVGDITYYKTENIEVIESQQSERFPKYKRSPRIIKKPIPKTVEIQSPTSFERFSKGGIVKLILPPLVTAGGTVAMSFVMSRGLYVYIGLITTAVTLTFSITSYISDKKRIKVKNKKIEDTYDSFLKRKRKQLKELYTKEIEAYKYQYPSINELSKMIERYDSRIYERDINNDDFLDICIGHERGSSATKIKLAIDELNIEESHLIDEAKNLQKEYRTIDKKPVCVNLKRAHLGIVGDEEDIHMQIKQILAQLTFYHSYHDIEIMMLYNGDYKGEFDYVKWFPHFKISAINISGNICSESIRDQALSSFAQILRYRKEQRNENKQEKSFYPHYIIIVDDFHLLMDHFIMEYLQEPDTRLGFSLIFSAKQSADLPENIKTILQVNDHKNATLLLNEGETRNKTVNSVQINNANLHAMARNLSVLDHQKGVSSTIPEKVTFFDLYKIEQPDQLQVLNRWNKNESHKSLAVPLGFRNSIDIVELNLHEKAHGPHGLVAGTTGSGKSEIIQSYILSLAVCFHPHEVGFLLIDYKGGGMASLFKNLPHLLGTITNLDGSESLRALASIKSELKRRQEIFNENGVNNIIQYNKLFKAGKAKEPLPSLFIISDEFAELKKEQPEFMSELVSAARIGRSLGIKLILATQKPSGVVDDQIWSNSKFKLALKVQNEADSREVLKTPDAAYITQAGRSYLQVGNNEIYELFQSAWSGAPYEETKENEEKDYILYKLNELGQLEILNKDLSVSNDQPVELITQLDVVVDHINDEYSKLDVIQVEKPWLPPLATKIISKDVIEVSDLADITSVNLVCNLGIVDIPEAQKQDEYEMNFAQEGNLALFSSSGYGKTFALGTIMLDLAIKNNPKLLKYYILDFGNSALIAYSSLPHVADYMGFDSNEKLSKLITIILDEIKARKTILAKAMVQNYSIYNELNKENPLPAIMIFVDNFDVVKELAIDIESLIAKVSRDGANLGIYVVVTGSRSGVIKYSTLNNFKNKIAGFIYDGHEANSIVGRSQYTPVEIKGRMLVKQKQVNFMQVYTMFDFADEIDFIEKLKEYIKKVQDSYSGEKNKGIPVLPDTFNTNDFDQFERYDNVEIICGLNTKDVKLADAKILGSPYLVVGPPNSGKTNFVELVLSQIQDVEDVYIFDDNKLGLYKYKGINNNINYIQGEEEIRNFVDALSSEIEIRKENLKQDLVKNPTLDPQTYYRDYEDFIILIEDIENFNEITKKEFSKLHELLKESGEVGVKVIATAQSAKIKGYDDMTKYFKTAMNGMVLGDQNLFSLSIKECPEFGYGRVFSSGAHELIRIPKYVNSDREGTKL